MADTSLNAQPGFNTSKNIVPSAAYTATHTSVITGNHCGRGIRILWDVTAATASPSVVLTVLGYNAAGNTYILLQSAAVTGTNAATAVNHYEIFPDATASANLIVNQFVPSKFALVFTHADTDSITYSVDIDILN